MGHVKDATTGEAIPFVNMIVKGTTLGTLTDFNGNYSLEFKVKADSLKASLLGYYDSTKKISMYQFQTLDFSLTPRQYNLQEVVVHYKGNPADVILKKVIAHKNSNMLQSFDTYQYKAYTKIEIDANNISEKLRNRKLFKPFEFVWNYIDTSTINGKSFLPVFLSETMSDVYYRKSPRSKKEIIQANRLSGLENQSVSQFLGNQSQEVDVYKNYVSIFDKNFTSPISDFGLEVYKYYLVDSSFIGQNWCYHLMFKPKRKQELTFTGNIWITDTTFAVRKVEMRIASDANINFINDLAIAQEYEWTDNRFWLLTKDKFSVDFNIIENARKVVGFFAHRTVHYSDFQFDIPETEKFLSQPSNVIVEPESNKKDDAFWSNNRPDKLSETEAGIYKMVDSVKKIPTFRTYSDIIYGIATGYLSWGKFELGPYFKVFSYNAIEGARFRVGGRTANSFSKKIQLQGYLAYGTLDNKFKGGGDLIYMFRKNPRRDLTAAFKWDLEQLGLSPSAFSTDNILSSLFHRGPNNKLTMVREYKLAYEHEWFNGLINTLTFTHREIFPLGMTRFVVFPEGPAAPEFMNSIYTSEIRLDTRLSWHEKFVNTEFYRYTISSNYPIISVSFAYGIPNTFKSDYEYEKLQMNIQQWFNFTTIGWSKYKLEAGRIWGTSPYPLLKNHEGNQTFLYDMDASNLMNYYEFVSDTWFSIYYTHHFDGLFFNHIPLFRKLKWREVLSVRCVYGTLLEKNQNYSLFPDQMRSFEGKPYWEAGAGIENIFKVFRIDAVWRMTHLDDIQNPNVSKFGLFVSMNFTF
ncbi:MAG: DUF5686 and carboxypeptidase regulatory-like domain-containing protein [Bacteroidales bacterium]|jgi:hypothetical protein|nr:DUF5686 and carboxypeptidase regulatory-like domain-containing protein [Bacteroidales bacterium]